jgi:hypothetical protein
MHVCMHVCMYACMYACMYVYMHVYMYVCMYVCTERSIENATLSTIYELLPAQENKISVNTKLLPTYPLLALDALLTVRPYLELFCRSMDVCHVKNLMCAEISLSVGILSLLDFFYQDMRC